jgi:hypothetical protein
MIIKESNINDYIQKSQTAKTSRMLIFITPKENYGRLIMTNSFTSKLYDSYVRFDSIQIMDWPQKPFNIIYLNILAPRSLFIKEAKKPWNHLYFDSIQ